MANLTDVEVRKMLPRDKPYRKPDGDGLFVTVNPGGDKSWVSRYKLLGKSGSIGQGSYPEVSLREARRCNAAAQADAKAGRRPVGRRVQEQIEAARAGTTIVTVATMVDEWYAAHAERWVEHHRTVVRSRMQENVSDRIGHMIAADVTTAILSKQVLDPLIRRLRDKGKSLDLALRCCQHLRSLFAFGKSRGWVIRNEALELAEGIGHIEMSNGRRPAITQLGPTRDMLRRVEAQSAGYEVKLANRFVALTAMRPGEVRETKWKEFEGLDTDEPIWRIPGDRMKMKGRPDFVVPLSRQAVDVIQAVRSLSGHRPLVFPGRNNPRNPLSEGTINGLLKRGGYQGEHCAHGWRSSFFTVMNERNPYGKELHDKCLAHFKNNEASDPYNRGEYLEHRRRIMQEWADLLLEGFAPAVSLLKGSRRSPPKGGYTARRMAA